LTTKVIKPIFTVWPGVQFCFVLLIMAFPFGYLRTSAAWGG
jgi:hypothetical protein